MHERPCTRRGSGFSDHFPGFAGQALHLFSLVLLLDFRLHLRHLFHLVDSDLLMHISLARACECNEQDSCIFTQPVCDRVQAVVFAYLSRPEAQRVLITCILLLADQKDILLGRTEVQLSICLSTYSVPTPPLQPFLQPVVPGQGGVWDLDTISATSSLESDRHAVEEEDAETVQSR